MKLTKTVIVDLTISALMLASALLVGISIWLLQIAAKLADKR